MTDELLTAYDAQVRGYAEVIGASSWDRSGPLWRARFPHGGFVSYYSLEGLEGAALDRMIADCIAHFAADPELTSFEWKTRGHDRPTDLPERLLAAGFEAEEVETVMVGEAHHLAVEVPLGPDLVLERVDDRPDAEQWLTAAALMQRGVFGGGPGPEDLISRLARSAGLTEMWVVRDAERVVSAGRLEAVPDTAFAGLWGGATLEEYRGRGIYRALTAARAESALRRGLRYLYSDCTEMSRPILERSGLRRVTTTTPYVWHRPAGHRASSTQD